MDEVHNLVAPSEDIQKDRRRLEMLDRLKYMLYTAQNSVVVGFTATPLVGERHDYTTLLDVIKGRAAVEACLPNEGFVSYFMDAPFPVFPRVTPAGVPQQLPDAAVRECELADPPDDVPKPICDKGNVCRYAKELKAPDRHRLLKCCTTPTQAHHFVRTLADVRERCPDRQNEILRGISTKLFHLIEDVQDKRQRHLKTLVLAHGTDGFKTVLHLLRHDPTVLGYAGRPASEFRGPNDAEIRRLAGAPHSSLMASTGECPCHCCRFNHPDNARGGRARVMVADAKYCSEGVSFFGVRRLLLLDVPTHAAAYLQRIGRAVRFNGHGGLDAGDRCVDVRVYCATLPSPQFNAPSADEVCRGGACGRCIRRARDRRLGFFAVFPSFAPTTDCSLCCDCTVRMRLRCSKFRSISTHLGRIRAQDTFL